MTELQKQRGARDAVPVMEADDRRVVEDAFRFRGTLSTSRMNGKEGRWYFFVSLFQHV